LTSKNIDALFSKASLMEFEDRNGPDDTLLMEQQIELTDFPNTDEVKEVILGDGLLSNAH
jgi:hypothetical protein